MQAEAAAAKFLSHTLRQYAPVAQKAITDTENFRIVVAVASLTPTSTTKVPTKPFR